MVVVGECRRNDSRIGGLQDRIISNFDNKVIPATVTSPVAMSESFHLLMLRVLRQAGSSFRHYCLS